jgi:hypothetical protein
VLQETLANAGIRRIQIEKREYRFDSSLDEYVEGMGTVSSGRFVREMMGPDGWASFLERAKAAYRDRFADPVHDLTSAWLAIGTKG